MPSSTFLALADILQMDLEARLRPGTNPEWGEIRDVKGERHMTVTVSGIPIPLHLKVLTGVMRLGSACALVRVMGDLGLLVVCRLPGVSAKSKKDAPYEAAIVDLSKLDTPQGASVRLDHITARDLQKWIDDAKIAGFVKGSKTDPWRPTEASNPESNHVAGHLDLREAGDC